jgi:DnaK suppressor protein
VKWVAQSAQQRLFRQKRGLLEAARGGELEEQRRRELCEIEAALERIANETYGSCTRCDGAIGRDRLRAVPEAAFCLSCEMINQEES